MSLGKRILRVRLDCRRTQAEISQLTGIAVSYLSRLENNWINPSVGTLKKIAEALEVPISAFFDNELMLEGNDRCPVSLSGRCVLDQLHVARGRKPTRIVESYSNEQLEVLRMCNFLLQHGNRRVVTSLRTLIQSLLKLAEQTQPGPRLEKQLLSPVLEQKPESPQRPTAHKAPAPVRKTRIA
ncbi:MAG: helix-turn-helix transcriptional regulator [Acidobacteria bacterium]|nr:helix-turn-helix transcriptional regulator [Acidobacteriota bacterium]